MKTLYRFFLVIFVVFASVIRANAAPDYSDSTVIDTTFYKIERQSILLVSDSLTETDSYVPADSLTSTSVITDSVRPSGSTGQESWVRQLINNGFRINDPAIRYPKFARFCLKVYNWGDRTFNSYDPEYVEATGKNWKLFLHNDMWIESYSLVFQNLDFIRIQSNLFDDIGGTISFMAVSLDYTVNARTLFQHTKENRQRFNFNFVCALFSINANVSSTNGGTKITHFGKYEPIKHHHLDFNNIHSKLSSVNGFYIFNHRHYSHAAAYCYSKYQLKSAGSWLLGFNYDKQEIDIDFTNLPQEMLDYLPNDMKRYNLNYRDLAISGGYGHSWVPKPRKWLLNLTVMPSFGWRHSYNYDTDNIQDDRRDFISASMRGLLSAVYNNRSLYVALKGSFRANLYFSRSFTFANTSEILYATVGVRF